MKGKECDLYKVIRSHYGRGKAWVMGMSHWRVIRTLWNKGKAGGLADILRKEPRNDATECLNDVMILG
jgi:hypothetical protein